MTWVLAFISVICIFPKCSLLYTTAKEHGKHTLQVSNDTTTISYGPMIANKPSISLPCRLDKCSNQMKLEWHEFYINPDESSLIYTTMKDMPFYHPNYTLCGTEAVICADGIPQNQTKYFITCNFMQLSKAEYNFLSNNSLHIIAMNETLSIPIYSKLDNPTGSVNVCYPLSHALKECPFKLSIRSDMYHIFDNKTLYEKSNVDVMGQYFEPAEYGMWNFALFDDFRYEPEQGLAFKCASFKQKQDTVRVVNHHLATQIIRICSIICLIIVFTVHIVFPSINYHSKPLLCHVICIIGILVIQIMRSPAMGVIMVIEVTSCFWVAGFQYYFTLCAFFWINVMAFDIWRTFSKVNAQTGTGMQCHLIQCLGEIKPRWCKRSFPMYCLYAVGIPTIMLICVIIFHVKNISPTLSPVFSVESFCWFKNVFVGSVFMYGLLAIIILENLIFFSLTVYNLLKISKQSKLVNKKISKLLILVSIKLFTLMSLTWIFQELQWTMNPLREDKTVVWFLMDLVMASQGIFIFIIYMCKSSTYQTISSKFQESSISKIFRRREARRPISTLISLVQTNSNKSNYSQDVTEEQRTTDN